MIGLRLAVWLPVFFSVLLITGCAGSRGSDTAFSGSKGPAIASVNGDKITANDLKRELALRTKKDPTFHVTPETAKDQLELMIDKRLLIQEAVRRKITEEQSFENAIRNFWEQTLIRLLLDRMSADFDSVAFASEQDIQDYYARLFSKAAFEVLRGDRIELERALQKTLKEGQTPAWQRLGPVTFDDLNSEMLEQAFDWPVGETRVTPSGDDFYLIRLSAKEAATPPPLESIREKIKLKIHQKKQRQAFEEWLKGQRAKSKIEVK